MRWGPEADPISAPVVNIGAGDSSGEFSAFGIGMMTNEEDTEGPNHCSPLFVPRLREHHPQCSVSGGWRPIRTSAPGRNETFPVLQVA